MTEAGYGLSGERRQPSAVYSSAEVWITAHCEVPGGPGEWIAKIELINANGDRVKHEMSATKPHVSEEQLDLRGAIESLTWLKEQDLEGSVTVWCRSTYLKDTFGRGRYDQWVANDWKLASGYTPKNSDRLHQLHALVADRSVCWKSLDELDHVVSVPLDQDFQD